MKSLAVLAAIVMLALAVAGAVTGRIAEHAGAGLAGAPLPEMSLLQVRDSRPTRLLTQGPSPQTYNPHLDGPGHAVWYPSNGKQLLAWLVAPNAGGTRPAILYCHHGYALDDTDIATVQPFVDAGYIVMLPSYRGENGNAGSFEMDYGEVDDARSALIALETDPQVDPHHVFVVGFGAGGTVAALLAESSAPLTRAVACSAAVGMPDDAPSDPNAPWPLAPFDWKNPAEDNLRSADRHLRDLTCPLHLYYGDEETDLIQQANPLPDAATRLGKVVTLTIIPHANEGNVVQPWIQAVLADFGSAPQRTPLLNNADT